MSPLTCPVCFSVLIFEEAFFKTCQRTKTFFCKTLQHKLCDEEPQGRRAAFISSSETVRETLKSLKLQLVWRSQTLNLTEL